MRRLQPEPTAPLGTVAQSRAHEDVSFKVSKDNELLG